MYKYGDRNLVTPTTDMIRTEARKLFIADNPIVNNPEDYELQEGGYWHLSRNSLMRSENSEYKIHVEKEARELGLLKRRKALFETEYNGDLEDFPVAAILREGCFLTGNRGCGKSNLLMVLVERMLSRKIEVKVFDSCLAWKHYPLPKIRVTSVEQAFQKWNVVYDLSRLSVLESREIVTKMMAEDIQAAISLTDAGMKPKCVYVLEEAQNLIPTNSLRAEKYMEISRFITQGRNFGLSYICSTQRLSTVDINLIEISGVRYWFKLEGARNLSKARWWLDKYVVWRLRDLPIGECYVQVGTKVKLLRVPMFQREQFKVKAI